MMKKLLHLFKKCFRRILRVTRRVIRSLFYRFSRKALRKLLGSVCRLR